MKAWIQIALGRLLDADLLFVEGGPPEAIYRFSHALIQDSAYDSLLKSRRQTLHRRAAEALIEANEELLRGGRPSLYRGRAPRRSCDRVVEQGGRRRAAPLGLLGEARSHIWSRWAIAMAEKAERAAALQGIGDTEAIRADF